MADDFITTLRRARKGTMVDVRTDDAIDSFPVESVLYDIETRPHCGCSTRGMCAEHFKQRQADDRFPSYMKGMPNK